MPTFDCEVDVNDFMDELSQSEIKEVIEWLEDHEEDFSDIPYGKLNFDESELMKSLNKIKNNLILITKEEMDIINSITKRF
jgi:hypothetical protein